MIHHDLLSLGSPGQSPAAVRKARPVAVIAVLALLSLCAARAEAQEQPQGDGGSSTRLKVAEFEQNRRIGTRAHAGETSPPATPQPAKVDTGAASEAAGDSSGQGTEGGEVELKVVSRKSVPATLKSAAAPRPATPLASTGTSQFRRLRVNGSAPQPKEEAASDPARSDGTALSAQSEQPSSHSAATVKAIAASGGATGPAVRKTALTRAAPSVERTAPTIQPALPSATAPLLTRRAPEGGRMTEELARLIVHYARVSRVDPLLILEVMRQESRFRANAESGVGARGLMQFMPGTAERFRITNSFDPEQAVRGGCEYIAFLLRRYNGNIYSALAGYNAGEGAVDAFLTGQSKRYGNKVINPRGIRTAHGIPPYAETQNYVRVISANYFRAVQIAAALRGGSPSARLPQSAQSRQPRVTERDGDANDLPILVWRRQTNSTGAGVSASPVDAKPLGSLASER